MAHLCSVLIQLRTRYISYTQSVIDALAKVSMTSLPPIMTSKPKSDSSHRNNPPLSATRSNLGNSQLSLSGSADGFEGTGGGDMDTRDDSTQSTNTHGSEFPIAEVEASTMWTDYWVANEMPEPLVVPSLLSTLLTSSRKEMRLWTNCLKSISCLMLGESGLSPMMKRRKTRDGVRGVSNLVTGVDWG